MFDDLSYRLKTKALGNQLVIAVGSSCSNDKYSIPSLAEEIIRTFNINFTVEHRHFFFDKWNDLVAEAEKVVKKSDLIKFVREKVQDAKPEIIHRKIAAVPISNFIDTTFDRSLYKALIEAGRKSILHDWRNSQAMGIWKQSNPEEPNIFFMLPPLDDENSFWGIYEHTSKSSGFNLIQIENVRDMLIDKDLVLIDYPAQEAESILHLYRLHITTGKIVNYTTKNGDIEYWSFCGAIFKNEPPENLIDKLLPVEEREYTAFDGFIANRTIVDLIREKPFDCFISYFHGDKDFVRRMERDLHLRDIHIWRDDSEIEIGDSISGKIEEGLRQSYAFVIVLSPEALTRPWVKEELKAAYALRLAGEFKILPVLHKECEIPPFLADYKYADFREEKRYHEQIALLERSIKNAVRKAREKK
ncbi:MAG TPA: toll/interleukin-1 receptor domain-containing protein [Pyrinomonadaceae bacterium]|nr:toll/interleukin-1 receptor domain-containing protein [Pyrinomonadaceae bacterium]